MNVGTERKMKVLDRLRSFGNHFIYYSVKQSFVTGEGRAQDCAMTGSHSGCQRRRCVRSWAIKINSAFDWYWRPRLGQSCRSRHAEPAGHGWLTPTFSSSHSRRAQRLVHTPRGPCYFGPTWDLKSDSQYLFNIYLHAHTFISSTPLLPLPTTFFQLHVAFFFNFFFKFSPEISTTVAHWRTQGFLTLFSFTSTSFKDFFFF